MLLFKKKSVFNIVIFCRLITCFYYKFDSGLMFARVIPETAIKTPRENVPCQ